MCDGRKNGFLASPFTRALALTTALSVGLPPVAFAQTITLGPIGGDASSNPISSTPSSDGTYDLDYCLYFAIDMSGSIQNGFPESTVRATNSPEYIEALDEWKIMMHGIAAALRSEEFLTAVQHNYHGRIALNYDFIIASDWYGRAPREWMIIDDEQSAEAAAQVFEDLVEGRRLSSGGTNTLDTLEYAMDQVMNCPTSDPYVRRTIDIKFDGYDDLFKSGITSLYGEPTRHDGGAPHEYSESMKAYQESLADMTLHQQWSAELMQRAREQGIRINALTINVDQSREVRDNIMSLDDYADEYIANWWVYPVHQWEDFSDVMHRKLIDDISWNGGSEPNAPLPLDTEERRHAALYRHEYSIEG